MLAATWYHVAGTSRVHNIVAALERVLLNEPGFSPKLPTLRYHVRRWYLAQVLGRPVVPIPYQVPHGSQAASATLGHHAGQPERRGWKDHHRERSGRACRRGKQARGVARPRSAGELGQLVDPPRGKTKNPKLFEVDAAVEAIEMLISEGWEWVFVDTGPARIDLIEAGIAVADLVLIPTRPSAFDIEQTAICVELCENHGKAHAFVLNHAPAGAKVSKLTRSSIKFLQKNGSTVIDAPLTYQEAYMAAATVGKSAPEVERGDDAHKEIEALWAVVKKLLVGKVS